MLMVLPSSRVNPASRKGNSLGLGTPEWSGMALSPPRAYRALMKRVMECCRREDSSPTKSEDGVSGDRVSLFPGISLSIVFLHVPKPHSPKEVLKMWKDYKIRNN